MAKTINAVDVVIKVDNVVVGCLQSMDLTIERDMDPASCASSGEWDEVSPGRKRSSGSINAAYREFTSDEQAANFGYDDIFDLLDEGTKVNLSYGTTTSGSSRYTVPGYVNNLAFSLPETGIVTWSGGFTGSGPVVRATNPTV